MEKVNKIVFPPNMALPLDILKIGLGTPDTIFKGNMVYQRQNLHFNLEEIE